MFNTLICTPIIVANLVLLSGCIKPKEQPLKIFAAASLSSVLPQVAFVFGKQNPTIKIEFNFAASSLLARQIEQGARADIFFSASPQWMDFLHEKNLVSPGARINLLSNKLVLITPLQNEIKITYLHDLKNPAIRRIVTGDWSHVPVGIYAKQALQTFGIWDEIESKIIPAVDARAAVTYVERGLVDCGIVYRTDAMISKKVSVAFELPVEIQPEICYPVSALASGKRPGADSFMAFLKSETARQIFVNNGFEFCFAELQND